MQQQGRLMTYADFYTMIYARKHVKYDDYYKMINQARMKREQQEQCKRERPKPPPPPPLKRRDPHVVLGVMPGCSQAELKAAFHKRVWELHPDRKSANERPAAELAFKELSEAYRALQGGDVFGARWPFTRAHNRKRRPMGEYNSVFLEFMGVRRREREKTLSHVARSVLCDRLVCTL